MSSPATLGWILAGGRGRRLGMDKARARLAGKPLVAHVAERAMPQCRHVVVNSPDADLAALLPASVAVAGDLLPVRLGPLAGLLTGLRYAHANATDCEWLATFPVDTPFAPDDLVARLHAARGNRPAAVCAAGGRVHGALGLWSTALADDLEHAVLGAGLRRVDAWIEQIAAARLELAPAPVDPCFNINTPADLAAAERLLGSA